MSQQHKYYKMALDICDITVNEFGAELLYEVAMLVRRKKGGSDIKSLCHLKHIVKENHPDIIQWSAPTHAENHMI